MKISAIAALFFAGAATAIPSNMEERAVIHPNHNSLQTILVSSIHWLYTGKTVAGLSFQASVAGTKLSWNCSSDSMEQPGTGAFAPLKVHRCEKGAPLTFVFDDSTKIDILRMWYTKDTKKSYAGSAPVFPGNTTDFVVPLIEIEATPKTTPIISDDI